MALLKHIIVVLIASRFSTEAAECSKRFFDYDSFVCVCDSAFCDFLDPVPKPFPGIYTRVTSSRDGARFSVVNGTTSPASTGDISIIVNHNYDYQPMLGFGGAFTDATGINVVKLSQASQDNLLRSYFAPDGLAYSVCRIPIAGSDFSTHAYSYDDVDGDVDLQFFALALEDYIYKIPFIRKALELNPDLLLFGSPWAPPSWMKENGMANGTGGLIKEMWQPWANYLVKFVQEYESLNIPMWGITPQNEPLTGFYDFPWSTCAWSAEDMRDWIKTNMGPTFRDADLRRLKVMVLDHNRESLPHYPATIYEDPEATQYVDGTAVHWYTDTWMGPEVLTEIVTEFPDKFLLYTESCVGGYPEAVHLGEWLGAESYAANILDDVNHYSIGWVDWNLALDLQGGPNWANNFVDAPIIIDATSDEFYKQPTFYAMGHFSKFIDRGDTRLYSNVQGQVTSVKSAAFHKLDGSDVVIVLNMQDVAISVSIQNHVGQFINIDMEPKSIETIIITS